MDVLATDNRQSTTAVALPLFASLLLTGGVAWFFCTPPPHPSLSWVELLGWASLYVAIAALTHIFSIWIVLRLLQDHILVGVRPLITSMWLPVAWLPLLALLLHQQSIWVASLIPLIAIDCLLAIRQWIDTAATDEMDRPTYPPLFQTPQQPSLLRTVGPAIVAALVFELGLMTLAFGFPVKAGLLFALCTFLPVLSYQGKRTYGGGETSRSLIINTLLSVLVTCISLTPFLAHGRLKRAMTNLLHAGTTLQIAAPTEQVDPRQTDYSGVVLTLPPKPHEKVVPPAPHIHVLSTNSLTKPIIIPFDGVYWFFKRPDHRPKLNARIVRGDPTKANIRSTDFLPLSMEAHQYLGSSIQANCCSAIRVAIRNADDRPGAIYVEIRLQSGNAETPGSLSLGSVVLPSSVAAHIPLNRQPVEEVLRFLFPRSASLQRFAEIIVIVKPAQERSRAGAHIAIEHFELVP